MNELGDMDAILSQEMDNNPSFNQIGKEISKETSQNTELEMKKTPK